MIYKPSWVSLPLGSQTFSVEANPDSAERIGLLGISGGFHGTSDALVIRQASLNITRWDFPITVKNGCADSATVTIGQKINATDGIDASLGEAELPPEPPSGVFDARAVLPGAGGVGSLRDYRRDTLSIVTWRLKYQPGTCGCPLTFRWNRNLVPSNAVVTLKDEITGSLVNVDMKTDSIYTLTNCAISSLMIEYRRMVRRDVALTSGWNIMSMPVQATDMRKSMLFPSAASPAYRYSNGYISADTLKPAIGYWLKAGSATTTSMYGTRFANQTIPLTAGWNIVGPFDRTVAVNAVTGTPSGILQSPFYGYSNGYTVADSLRVGKGYWVKASQAGSLSLGPVYGKVGEQMTVQTDNWLRIEVEDNSGAATSVYLAKPDEIGRNFELPPVAPTGITDIRFEGDLLVENIEKHRFVLHANSTAYPLVIKIANARGETFGIKDLVTGTLLDATLREGAPVVVSLPLGKLELTRLGTAVNAPVAFALGQNYPNPFNPKTKIQFALPKDSDAKLTVYSTLGERVAEIVNGRFVAGYHDVEFDATNYASGVYYYRIEAGSFVSVKKMLVLK